MHYENYIIVEADRYSDFTRADCEPAHSKVCGPLSQEAGRPWSMLRNNRSYNYYVAAQRLAKCLIYLFATYNFLKAIHIVLHIVSLDPTQFYKFVK